MDLQLRSWSLIRLGGKCEGACDFIPSEDCQEHVECFCIHKIINLILLSIIWFAIYTSTYLYFIQIIQLFMTWYIPSFCWIIGWISLLVLQLIPLHFFLGLGLAWATIYSIRLLRKNPDCWSVSLPSLYLVLITSPGGCTMLSWLQPLPDLQHWQIQQPLSMAETGCQWTVQGTVFSYIPSRNRYLWQDFVRFFLFFF